MRVNGSRTPSENPPSTASRIQISSGSKPWKSAARHSEIVVVAKVMPSMRSGSA